MILGRKERDIKVGGEVFKMSFSSRQKNTRILILDVSKRGAFQRKKKIRSRTEKKTWDFMGIMGKQQFEKGKESKLTMLERNEEKDQRSKSKFRLEEEKKFFFKQKSKN